MKKLWVNVVPYEKSLAIAALEIGDEAVVLPEGDSDKMQQFGTIKPVKKVIGRILGISENTLHVRLNRAGERLKQELAELIEE